MSRSPLALIVLILTLMPVTFFAAGFFNAEAKPISQVQGANWKAACQKQGGSIYACCKGKETDCRDGCQSGNTCGNACTQCKNECSASYSVCVAKSVRTVPGTVVPEKSGTLKAQ